MAASRRPWRRWLEKHDKNEAGGPVLGNPPQNLSETPSLLVTDVPKKVFRVRRIPSDWHRDRLQELLAAADGYEDPIIWSFAEDVSTTGRGTGCPQQVATVSFGRAPILESPSHQDPAPRRALLQGPSSDLQSLDLDIDDTFLGLTVLYSPPAAKHKVDVIALPGLGGHAFGSFKEKNGSYMWLRDSLPEDLTDEGDEPIARIMIYGYESAVFGSESFQSLTDLASSLNTNLLRLAKAKLPKPIVFLAHSLGGLLFKQLFTRLSKSPRADDQQLFDMIQGVIFFGVPQTGMDIASLRFMAGNSPNRALIESLNQSNSQILDTQRQDFIAATEKKGHFDIFCFYETRESPTAMQGPTGKWSMTGPPAVLVTKSSATYGLDAKAENTCAINRNHSELVKYGKNDSEYQNAVQRIVGVVEHALANHSTTRADDGPAIQPSPPSNSKITPGHWNVPFARNKNFIGRESILSWLVGKASLNTDPDNCQMLAVVGMGGAGKSQIALELAYQMRHQHPEMSIFWVSALTASTFEISYQRIADVLTQEDADGSKTEAKAFVKASLSREERRWLLVVDNADDRNLVVNSSKGLSDYLPSSNGGSILFISRTRQVPIALGISEKNIIEVPVFTTHEGLSMLQINLRDDQLRDAQSTESLLTALGHLPLAIQGASAFMAEAGITTENFFGRYKDHEDFRLARFGHDDDYEKTQLLTKSCGFDCHQYRKTRGTVMHTYRSANAPEPTVMRGSSSPLGRIGRAIGRLSRSKEPEEVQQPQEIIQQPTTLSTWYISFHYIREHHFESAMILEHLCYFAEQDIPLFLIPYRRRWGARLDEFLGVLSSYGFISPRASGDPVLVHPLIQLSMRNILKENTLIEAVLQRVFDELRCKMDDDYEETYQEREKWNSFYTHAHSAWNYRHRMDLQDWEKIPQSRLAISLCTYLLNMNTMTHFNQARKIIVDARTEIRGLEWEGWVLGKKNLRIGIQLDSILALTLQKQGRYSQAEDIHWECVRNSEKAYGVEGCETLFQKIGLFETIALRGRCVEAIRGLKDIQNLIRRKKERPSLFLRLDDDDDDKCEQMEPKVILALAEALFLQKSYVEATELNEQILKDIVAAGLDPDHPAAWKVKARLAAIESDQGRHAEAAQTLSQALDGMQRGGWGEHPETFPVMVALTTALTRQGKYAAGEKIAADAMEIGNRVLDGSHPVYADIVFALAVSLQGQEKLTNATELFEHVMVVRTDMLGLEHPATQECQKALKEAQAAGGKGDDPAVVEQGSS